MRSRRSFFPQRKEGGSLPLEFGPEPAPQAGVTGASPAQPESPLSKNPVRADEGSLWLSVFMPALVLEAHVEPDERDLAAAVVAEQHGQLQVAARSVRAHKAGIAEGMLLSAALALVPDLAIVEQDERLVAYRLDRLASEGLRYTGTVSLAPPNALLLDVAASLRLFGGLDALVGALVADFAALGHRALWATAPTPQAALWLSARRPGTVTTTIAEARSALRDLPLLGLGWPLRVLRQFESLGVRTLGECRRLPRAGFAKRFGRERLDLLDRAYGDSPDLRVPWQAPVRFADEIELSAEVNDTATLREAAVALFERLARFLRQRHAAVKVMTLRFYPLKGPATVLTLRLGGAGQNVDRWCSLLDLKLDRLALEAPAVLVALSAPSVEPLVAQSLTIGTGTQRSRAVNVDVLFERLRARLGEAAVFRLAVAADQRPEYAMRRVGAGQRQTRAHCAGVSPWHELRRIPEGTLGQLPGGRLVLQRPLWLLSAPCNLGSIPGCEFRIVSGPERIETGWWDGRDVVRDYYIASSERGAWLWVFRDRREHRQRWYLQGYFG